MTTGVDFQGVLAAAAFIESELGIKLPAQLGRAGGWPSSQASA